MRHAYRSGAVSDEPPASGASSAGFPQDDTTPGARWAHSITSEIVNTIEDAGLTPDGSDLTQLRQAIAAKIEEAVDGLVIPPGVSLATVAQHLINNPSATLGATPAGLRAMLNALFPNTDGRAEFTTAGVHSYDWEWDVTKGFAIITGGGGGGGGGGSNNSSSVNGGGGGGGSNGLGGGAGGGGNDGADGTATQGGAGGEPSSLSNGGTGGGGGDRSSVAVGGTTHGGADGGGGGGGGYARGGGNNGHGGGTSVGGGGESGGFLGLAGGAGYGGSGNGGQGGVSEGGAQRAGGAGGGGLAGTVELSGLSLNDAMTITVGAGGDGGAAAAFGGDDGTDGGAGRVILIPLF